MKEKNLMHWYQKRISGIGICAEEVVRKAEKGEEI